MYNTIGMLLLAITMLLAAPTVTQAQSVQIGKPLHCVPMKVIWMGYDQDEDETLLFTAVHTGTTHPILTYWNTKTDKMTTIEFVQINTPMANGSGIVEQQYGCVTMVGDLTRIYDLGPLIKNKIENNNDDSP